jgi:hypothetical protein
MRTLWLDLQYGARILLRNPGFALITLLTLALGIGANTAIFSVVNAVMLRPLPVEKPSELAGVYTADYSGTVFGTSSYLITSTFVTATMSSPASLRTSRCLSVWAPVERTSESLEKW